MSSSTNLICVDGRLQQLGRRASHWRALGYLKPMRVEEPMFKVQIVSQCLGEGANRQTASRGRQVCPLDQMLLEAALPLGASEKTDRSHRCRQRLLHHNIHRQPCRLATGAVHATIDHQNGFKEASLVTCVTKKTTDTYIIPSRLRCLKGSTTLVEELPAMMTWG
jgi:hypothetical protein